MTDDIPSSGNGNDESSLDQHELSEALRTGLRQAGYHVLRAGYELLAGVSAFLEAVGGGSAEGEDGRIEAQRIEVE